MSNELLPCPFCGGEAVLKKYMNLRSYTDSEGNTFWRDEPDGWLIECINHEWHIEHGVGAAADLEFVSWGLSDENKQAVIEAWNQRAERTCEYDHFQDAREAGWQDSVMCQGYHVLKCGHRVPGDCCERPTYCCVCGVKVVGD